VQCCELALAACHKLHMSSDSVRQTALQAYDLLVLEQPRAGLDAFRRAVAAAGKSANPGKVREILAQAEEVGQQLDSYCHFIALKTFSAHGQPEECEQMLRSVLATTDIESRRAAAYALP
jgi:4-alpha-glucanotransferase